MEVKTEKLLSELKELLNESFDLALTEVKLEDSLTLTYSLTSIQLVQLAMVVEERYAIDLSDILYEIDIVGDVIKHLTS